MLVYYRLVEDNRVILELEFKFKFIVIYVDVLENVNIFNLDLNMIFC